MQHMRSTGHTWYGESEEEEANQSHHLVTDHSLMLFTVSVS